MTDHIKAAGASLAAFIDRHFATLLSAVFAVGFIWAQFDGVRTQLHETRAQLRTLIAQYNVDRSTLLADQRDVERLVSEVAFLRERMIAQRVDLQALSSRVTTLEALLEPASRGH